MKCTKQNVRISLFYLSFWEKVLNSNFFVNEIESIDVTSSVEFLFSHKNILTIIFSVVFFKYAQKIYNIILNLKYPKN